MFAVIPASAGMTGRIHQDGGITIPLQRFITIHSGGAADFLLPLLAFFLFVCSVDA
ncbi:MAG: hypothetical protein LBD68_01240 [Zoogloeaceae bacterium]|nr:hypothetical protein [Zoogloeaceae bacterium]